MATVALPTIKIDPHTGLPIGAPTRTAGESLKDYQARLNKWLQDHFNPDKQPLGPLPPTSDLPAILNPAAGVQSAVHTTEEAIKAVFNPNTWVRVGEVVVGVICIAVGLSAMTKANPVAKATKAAAKATVL